MLQRPPCELTFELLNARVQTIDLGPGEIDGDAQLSIIAEPSRQQKASRSLLTGVGSLERHFGLKQ